MMGRSMVGIASSCYTTYIYKIKKIMIIEYKVEMIDIILRGSDPEQWRKKG